MTTTAERPISIAASIQADQEPRRMRRLRNILAAIAGGAPCPLCRKAISPEAIDNDRFEFNESEELIHGDCAEIARLSRPRESHTIPRDEIQDFHLRAGEEDVIFEVVTGNGHRVCMSGLALQKMAEDRREADALLQDGGTTLFHVNEYLVDRAYGGPEEGGWHYPAGRFLECHAVTVNQEEAHALLERLEEQIREDNRELPAVSSVLSRGQHALMVEEFPGRDFPEHRPCCE